MMALQLIIPRTKCHLMKSFSLQLATHCHLHLPSLMALEENGGLFNLKERATEETVSNGNA